MNKIKTEEIEELLRIRHDKASIAVARKIDAFMPQTESDFIAVQSTGVCYEYEIKVSRSDWLAEQVKRRWRVYCGIFKNDNERRRFAAHDFRRPNYFYVITVEGVVKMNELPDWCGLMIVTRGETGLFIETRKKAKRMCAEPLPVKHMLRFARAMRFRDNGERSLSVRTIY